MTGKCPGEAFAGASEKEALLFHRSYVGGALFSYWTRMPFLLLAAILCSRGEAALRGGRLGQKAEWRDGKKQASLILH